MGEVQRNERRDDRGSRHYFEKKEIDMAFSATNLPICIVPGMGVVGVNRLPALFGYRSSDPSTSVGGVTGYLAACGAQVSSGATQIALARSPNNVGMQFGDYCLVSESSNGNTPGRSFLATVKGSTFNQSSTTSSTSYTAASGFDITLSSATT
jgi:hypothetical protein